MCDPKKIHFSSLEFWECNILKWFSFSDVGFYGEWKLSAAKLKWKGNKIDGETNESINKWREIQI